MRYQPSIRRWELVGGRMNGYHWNGQLMFASTVLWPMVYWLYTEQQQQNQKLRDLIVDWMLLSIPRNSIFLSFFSSSSPHPPLCSSRFSWYFPICCLLSFIYKYHKGGHMLQNTVRVEDKQIEGGWDINCKHMEVTDDEGAAADK